MKTIVDTSALIAYLRKEPPGKIVFRLLEEEAIIVPAVCIFELLAGIKSKKHLEQRRQLLDLSEIAGLNREISEKAAELFTELRSKGLTIDNEDLLIAATSISCNLPLLTVNKKHFSYIAGLNLVEW
ncbi:MAG: type II toxin-antitoxin system VapC family toxin [Spirochaetales bacterium]|nr:type II toxin-antitoxin system VapC family toxin [Spirochaetales bacterium]